MSKTGDKASNAEQDERQDASVFDFLYHDVRRVGSFLAQFDESGHLQQVTQSEGVMRSQSRGFRIAAGGEIALVGSANLDVSRTPTVGGAEASERVYDPLWTNARTLLDYLIERKLLERDLAEARIGQFVLASGELAIIDLPMLRQLWDLPIIRSTVRSGAALAQSAQENSQGQGSRAPRRRENRQKRQPTMGDDPAEFLLQAVKYLPHVIQATLKTTRNGSVCCSLGQESLVGSSADLMLKHGAVLSGNWNIVGILDAVPENEELQPESVASALGNTPLVQAAESLAPLVRHIMGRPSHAYGLTPLLIFRDVSA